MKRGLREPPPAPVCLEDVITSPPNLPDGNALIVKVRSQMSAFELRVQVGGCLCVCACVCACACACACVCVCACACACVCIGIPLVVVYVGRIIFV